MQLPGDTIETFLRQHPGSFCADCLAEMLDIPAGQVSMVAHRLQDALGFFCAHSVCSHCRRKRFVVKAVAAG